AHKDALRDLDLEKSRVDAGIVERTAHGFHEGGLVELQRGDVDRHADGQHALPLPSLLLQRALTQGPVTYGADKTGLFGDRDELGGRDHAEFRAAPPK